MKLSPPTLVLICIFLLSALYAVEKQYQLGQILTLEQKSNTRVLYYIVNTPVTKDEPYYEVSVRLKDTIYVGRYIPRHAGDTLPPEWGAGSTVESRVDGRHLFLKRPGGGGIEFAIAKHTVAKPEQKASPPAPPNN